MTVRITLFASSGPYTIDGEMYEEPRVGRPMFAYSPGTQWSITLCTLIVREIRADGVIVTDGGYRYIVEPLDGGFESALMRRWSNA